MPDLKKYYCVRFNRKSGKIDVTLEGLGKAMLNLWALQNTTKKTQDSIVFEKETGDVVSYYEGTGDFPKIIKEDLGNIEKYCPGLLEALG